MKSVQSNALWEWYLTANSKDGAFETARRSELFPDGVTRAEVRAVLAGVMPEAFVPKAPNVLFFDIETAILEGVMFDVWKTNIPPSNLMKDWYMLSYSYSWGVDGEAHSIGLDSFDPWKNGDFEDDSALLESLWELLDQADYVVAHNGERFDVPKMNTRFLAAGMMPPSPYQIVDTLKVVKRKFKLVYNNLKFVAEFLGCEAKADGGGVEVWKGCRRGDDASMQHMVKYGKQDVVVLQQVYDKIKAWIPSHPNFGVVTSTANVCAVCGSENLEKGKPYPTQAGMYPVWRCLDCDAQSRERRTSVPKEVREGLLISVAR